jgi:hypothetical protein
MQSPLPRIGESRLYGEVNACSSSRAASLKFFSGSIPAVLFISTCGSWIVLFGAKKGAPGAVNYLSDREDAG